MGIISSAMLHSWEEMGCLDDNNSEELKTENIKLKKDIEQLKAENEIILNRLTQYEEDADIQVCLFSDVKRLEQDNAELKAKIKK